MGLRKGRAALRSRAYVVRGLWDMEGGQRRTRGGRRDALHEAAEQGAAAARRR